MTLSPEVATLLRAALAEADASESAGHAYYILEEAIANLLPPLSLSPAEAAVHVHPSGMFVSYVAGRPQVGAEQLSEQLDLPW